jgi:hypothetical protein
MMAIVGVPELIERWAHYYADRKLVSAAVTYVHLAGILLGGGLSVASDRASFQLGPDWPGLQDELDRLYSVHHWVIAGLGFTIASGLLMLLSDLHTFVTAPLYWTKMGLVAVLLTNGYVRLRSEIALRQGRDRWRTFHRTSAASMALWFLVLLGGAFLTTIS